MTQEEFSRFKDSPVKRTKRRGLLRNVAIALGNWGSAEAVPPLAAALNDEEALARGHAAWALGRIATEAARQALQGREEVRGMIGCGRSLRRRWIRGADGQRQRSAAVMNSAPASELAGGES